MNRFARVWLETLGFVAVGALALAPSAFALPAPGFDGEPQSGGTGEQQQSEQQQSGHPRLPDLVSLQLLNINDFHGRISGELNAEKTGLVSSTTMNFAYTIETLKAAGVWTPPCSFRRGTTSALHCFPRPCRLTNQPSTYSTHLT